MLLHKYIKSKYWYRTLSRCEIKVSKPSELNDPFDCIGGVVGTLGRNGLKRFHSVENFRKNMMDRSVSDDVFRVLCLTDADADDPESEVLFWSHYADGGRGVRITFDVSDTKDFVKSDCLCAPVRYAQFYPQLDTDAYEKSPHEEYKNFLVETIWTKGLSWAYEREVRMIFQRKGLVFRRSVSGVNVRKFEIVKFSPKCVKEVVFGVNFDMSGINDKVRRLICSLYEDSNIFKRTFIDASRYRYQYKQLFDGKRIRVKLPKQFREWR